MLTGCIERKALEQSLVDEEEEEEEEELRYLNLEGEDDGETTGFWDRDPDVDTMSFFCAEDVWDDDSAYLEMLANEVRRGFFVFALILIFRPFSSERPPESTI